MKSPVILTALLSIVLFSCAKETPQVKHKSNMSSTKENITNVQVANEEDPICHMKTAEFLKDTAVYKNKTYGFCSAYCKDEFKQNPEKYAQK
ncbi:YHS domain-containing protein [Chryseobacterium arthrosphaerae]|uniref:YHS domain-containing protein n=2 Tax=Chryseobacterium arthrosphaerae TaxID=651561 RepID=A0ABU7QZX5_9FLAO|nr:YHS domain-containing protein [Chryseobacterium arthrosphaerae]MDG4651739.1 YHS domain-containing protein [Chryseobacterium arthrosphaerae]QUY55624.1 YHS domain-containing protein [Chryseobacterium arthrosphaerae]UEQ75519.1 YHS domain-containing protein [Chryseobacterium arthrosphaerae]WES96821.1 YHS domain-containing protein [Chryseobacterium arthrosphaerae]